MTQLRQKMLEELQRLFSSYCKTYVRIVHDFAAQRISTDHLNSWGRNTFANTRHICFKAKSVGGYDVSSVGTLRGLHAGT